VICANSPSSPEPAADCSAACCSDGNPSSSSSTTPTASACSPPDSPTCPAIATCETSTRPPAPATLSPEDSPASHLVRPGSGSARTIPATCGHTPFVYWSKAEHRWASSRMCLDFSAQDTSEPYSETWPKRGSMRSGACWEQTMSVPRIDASGCGFWRTPRAIYGEHPGMTDESHLTGQAIAASWPTPKGSPSDPDFARTNREGSGGDDLVTRVARGGATRQTWPTPNTCDATGAGSAQSRLDGRQAQLHQCVKTWATPSAARGGPCLNGGQGNALASDVAKQMPTPTANRRSGLQSHGVNVITGSLNPTWVEWLQGWPRGWTDCEHSVTDGCLRQWRQRSRCWLGLLGW